MKQSYWDSLVPDYAEEFAWSLEGPSLMPPSSDGHKPYADHKDAVYHNDEWQPLLSRIRDVDVRVGEDTFNSYISRHQHGMSSSAASIRFSELGLAARLGWIKMAAHVAAKRKVRRAGGV